MIGLTGLTDRLRPDSVIGFTGIRRFGPNRLRMKDARDQSVRILIEHGYAQLEIIGRQTHIVLNPAAIAGDL